MWLLFKGGHYSRVVFIKLKHLACGYYSIVQLNYRTSKANHAYKLQLVCSTGCFQQIRMWFTLTVSEITHVTVLGCATISEVEWLLNITQMMGVFTDVKLYRMCL